MDKNRKYPVFYSNLFRAVDMEFTQEVVYKNIHLYRYQIPDRTWLNATNNPLNEPYFQFTADGIYNITSMTQHAPIFLTKPHFVDVGAKVADRVEAIWIDDEEWDTFFDVEPISGAAFHVESANQINIELIQFTNVPVPDSDNKTTWFKNLGDPLYMPLFWAKQEDGIDDESASKFIGKVYGALFISDMAYYGGYTFGIVFLLGGLALCSLAIWHVRKMGANGFSESSNLLKEDSSAPGPMARETTSVDPEAGETSQASLHLKSTHVDQRTYHSGDVR